MTSSGPGPRARRPDAVLDRHALLRVQRRQKIAAAAAVAVADRVIAVKTRWPKIADRRGAQRRLRPESNDRSARRRRTDARPEAFEHAMAPFVAASRRRSGAAVSAAVRPARPRRGPRRELSRTFPDAMALSERSGARGACGTCVPDDCPAPGRSPLSGALRSKACGLSRSKVRSPSLVASACMRMRAANVKAGTAATRSVCAEPAASTRMICNSPSSMRCRCVGRRSPDASMDCPGVVARRGNLDALSRRCVRRRRRWP